MQKIKTVQPYKLYAKLAEAKPSVRKSFIGGIVIIIGASLFAIIEDPIGILLPLALIILTFPVIIYNPWLKQYYQPEESFATVREIAHGKTPSLITKYLPIIGIILGILIDIFFYMFPCGILILGGSFSLIAFVAKKNPKIFMEKQYILQQQYHQDVDYNAKVDLNTTYGINDKLLLSFQNFTFDQKKLEDGNFILGVSPLGVYFACKKHSVEKLFIKYEEIDTLGILLGMSTVLQGGLAGNVSILNIKTIHNNELNIIIDGDEGFLISPVKIFDKLLTTVDEFLLNGSVASATVERRRRVVTTPSSTVAATSQVESSTSGRAIEMDTTTETIKESSEDANKRVIDIEFTPEVVAELAQGSFIEANRSIDIF